MISCGPQLLVILDGPANISSLVNRVSYYHYSLQFIAPQAVANVNRARDGTVRAWQEMKDACNWAETTLLGYQAKVKENKSSDDKKSIGLSLMGTGSGLVAVGSLLTPITWPVAAGSFLAAGISGEEKVRFVAFKRIAVSIINRLLSTKLLIT